MCKSRTITYSCSCTITFRLSSCHGAYTAIPRRKPQQPVTLCKSIPTLAFKSPSKCGPCTKETHEEKLSSELVALRTQCTPSWGAEASDEDLERLADAESKYEHEKYKLDRMFPDGRFKKSGNVRRKGSSSLPQQQEQEATAALHSTSPSSSPASATPSTQPERKSSLLRTEVLPSDVVSKWEPNTTSYSGNWNDENAWGSGWGSGTWKSLEEEIRENDAARLEIGLTSNSTSVDAWESEGWPRIEDLAPTFEIEAPISSSTPSTSVAPSAASVPAVYSFEEDDYEAPDGLGFLDVAYMEQRKGSASSVVDEGYESSDAQWKENQRPTTPTRGSSGSGNKRPSTQRRTPSYLRMHGGLPMELTLN